MRGSETESSHNLRRIDACIWTKNSATLLPKTLRRFNEVLPEKVIEQKIMIDDHSQDATVSIGKEFGWSVYPNPSNGIASAANEALRRVKSEFFMSIEHDILLASNWWPRIFEHMKNKNVGVAQGTRMLTQPTLRAIYGHHVEHSIDNNIYRTKIVRDVGGFPYTCRVCTDTWLKRKIEAAGYKWEIDDTVVSEHVRSSIRQEADHRENLHRICTCKSRYYPLKYLARITLTSPVTGLKIAIRSNKPKAVFVYPYIRLKILNGWMNGYLRADSEQHMAS